MIYVEDNLKCTSAWPFLCQNSRPEVTSPGGGGTPLQEANGDVPLDGVAFSRLE